VGVYVSCVVFGCHASDSSSDETKGGTSARSETAGASGGGARGETGGETSTSTHGEGGKNATGGTRATTSATTNLGGQGNEETWPTTPPAQICDNDDLLAGPTTAPKDAVIIPAGDNAEFFRNESYRGNEAAKTVYWFAPGVHTLGNDRFGQIIPADDTTFIGAKGAILDGQNINWVTFGQPAKGVRVAYLEIRNFGGGIAQGQDQGAVNHDAGEGWTIEYNYMHDNGGAAVFVGKNGVLRYNCLRRNGQYGFQGASGATDIVIDHNEVSYNNTNDWESKSPGCGCTGGCKFWDVKRAKVTNNWFHHNFGAGIWADYNNVEFTIEHNLIEDNDKEGIEYEISFNFMIRYNNIRRNQIARGLAGSEGFPWGAIYISEAGGDSRAGSLYATSEIHHNHLEDNWDGIVLWENADRFCRPPGEGVTDKCPFFEQTFGTRYKTQNVMIHDNVFRFNKTNVGCKGIYCGRNGIFSNWGITDTYPSTVIEEAITKNQNNHFSNNAYYGPWGFAVYDQSDPKSWQVWRGSEYEQDVGSTWSP
jgi:hypothetical protein